MTKRQSPFIALTLIALLVHGSSADPPQRTNRGVGRAGPNPTFRFKSSNLPDQVEEAMRNAKQGYIGGFALLVRMHKKNPDKPLSYIQKYMRSENFNVRYAVVNAASRVHTHKSLDILTRMTADREVGNSAVASLYANYTRPQLAREGGRKLQSALMRYFINDRYATYGAVLLPIFGRKPSLVRILKNRRASLDVDVHPNEIICIDLALSELNDPDAISRTLRTLQPPTKEALVILEHFYFSDNKAVLSSVADLLKNKGNASDVGFPEHPIYTRYCDEALVALRRRFEPSAPPSYGPAPRSSDAELAVAHKKYKAQIAALK